MKRFKKEFLILPTIILFAAVFLPVEVLAQPSADAGARGGFVPCSGSDCTFCHFVQLGSGILNWLFAVVFVVFGVLIFVAGFGLVTSGGNQSRLDDAKKKLTNAMIGILIIFTAWLVVDTLLKTTLTGGDGDLGTAFGIDSLGPWNQVECTGGQNDPQITATQNAGPATAVACLPDPNGGADICGPVTTAANGDICVPNPISSEPFCVDPSLVNATVNCSVTPLSPITDPLAQQMEAGQRVIWTNTDSNLQSCVNQFIAQVGGSVSSAYRPPAYQAHLYEVSTKACQLDQATDPACDSIRNDVLAELANHGLPLCGAVAQNSSTHSSGRGVDIAGINHSDPVVQQAAQASCLNWRNYANDPFHYDLISGCTCP